jgi:polyhydroxyalkanoate synthase
VLGGSGHIAGIVNPPKKDKYFYATGKLAKTAASWNKDSVKHDGSWWPYWAKWLKKYSGKQVKALKPYKSGTTYYAAPGKYVLEKV